MKTALPLLAQSSYESLNLPIAQPTSPQPPKSVSSTFITMPKGYHLDEPGIRG